MPTRFPQRCSGEFPRDCTDRPQVHHRMTAAKRQPGGFDSFPAAHTFLPPINLFWLKAGGRRLLRWERTTREPNPHGMQNDSWKFCGIIYDHQPLAGSHVRVRANLRQCLDQPSWFSFSHRGPGERGYIRWQIVDGRQHDNGHSRIAGVNRLSGLNSRQLRR